MREILFRGKTIEQPSEWIYGSFWKVADDYYIITSASSIGKHIYKESLGEFTGLLDKNKNKIFEGDILNAFGDRPMEVFWNEETLSWEIRDEGTKDCEVNHLLNTLALGEILVESEFNEMRTIIVDNTFDKYIKKPVNNKKSKKEDLPIICAEEYINNNPSCLECIYYPDKPPCEVCEGYNNFVGVSF